MRLAGRRQLRHDGARRGLRGLGGPLQARRSALVHVFRPVPRPQRALPPRPSPGPAPVSRRLSPRRTRRVPAARLSFHRGRRRAQGSGEGVRAARSRLPDGRSVRLRARGATPGARPGDAPRPRTGEGALPDGVRARDSSDSVRWAAASGRGPTVDDGVLCRRDRIEPRQRPLRFRMARSRQLAVRAAEVDRSRGRAGRRGGRGGAPAGRLRARESGGRDQGLSKDPAGPSGAGDKRVLDGLERDALAWLAGHRLAKTASVREEFYWNDAVRIDARLPPPTAAS